MTAMVKDIVEDIDVEEALMLIRGFENEKRKENLDIIESVEALNRVFKNLDVIEAVEALNRVFKKEDIESTTDQIYADLAARGYDNLSDIREGINGIISYMNKDKDTGASWKNTNLSSRVAALYIMQVD